MSDPHVEAAGLQQSIVQFSVHMSFMYVRYRNLNFMPA